MKRLLSMIMNTQPQNVMLAKLVGTPTVIDGRVSNFSSSNYLVLQDDITEIPTNFEIQIRISIPATNSGYAIHFLSYLGNSSGIRVFASGKLSFYSRNNDGNVVEITGTTVLSLDTFYFIKIKKVGNTITLYSSLDKNIWITEGTTTTTSTIPLNSKIGFGHCGDANNNNYIFNGTLDLNRSYIKIDDTKYKLQAVVGYTVVGSPTITDGVVSGFSGSDYIQTNGKINVDEKLYLEYGVKLTTSNSISNGFIIGSADKYGCPGIQVYNNGFYSRLFFQYSGGGTTHREIILSNISVNTTYWIKVIFDYKKKKIKTFTSTDGINWNSTVSDFPTSFYDYSVYSSYINLGFADNIAFNGTLDLNNTYIKINNKLWFNGLEQ